MRKVILLFLFFCLSLFSQTLRPPVGGEITSDFGPRNWEGYDWHEGVDYDGVIWIDLVEAVQGGNIGEIAYEGGGAGWYIRVQGDVGRWTYMHLFENDPDNNPISPDSSWEVRMATLENPDDSVQTSNRHIFILWNNRNNNRAEEILTQYSQEIPSWYVRADSGDPGYDSLNPYILNETGDGRVLTQGSVGDRDTVGPLGTSGSVGGDHNKGVRSCFLNFQI